MGRKRARETQAEGDKEIKRERQIEKRKKRQYKREGRKVTVIQF